MEALIFLIYTLLFWILVYAFEAKHDLNYRTIDGSEKLYDAAMFAILHISYASVLWYFTDFWTGFLLGTVSVMVRLVFHDGFINYFRSAKWCGKFTVDNKKDYWDMFMVWLYDKGITPCYISIGLLLASIAAYLIVVL